MGSFLNGGRLLLGILFRLVFLLEQFGWEVEWFSTALLGMFSWRVVLGFGEVGPRITTTSTSTRLWRKLLRDDFSSRSSLLQVQARLRKRNRLWLHKAVVVVKFGRLEEGLGTIRDSLYCSEM